MPRGIKSDTIIAGCALVAALCALGGSLYDGYQNRKNMRISQRSILRMDWSAKDGQVDIKIQNYGNGPAIVKWMAVFVDGTEAKNWDDVTKRYKPGASRYFGMLWPSSVMRNDADVMTLYRSSDPQLVEAFVKDRYAVQVIVRSCSLYDECETVYLWNYKTPRPELPAERTQTFEIAPM